jgi:hypothetical protein
MAKRLKRLLAAFLRSALNSINVVALPQIMLAGHDGATISRGPSA